MTCTTAIKYGRSTQSVTKTCGTFIDNLWLVTNTLRKVTINRLRDLHKFYSFGPATTQQQAHTRTFEGFSEDTIMVS